MLKFFSTFTKPWRMTLALRLASFALAAALIPSLIIGFIAFFQAQQSLRQQFGDSVSQTSAVIGASIERFLGERRADVEVFARLNIVANPEVDSTTKRDFLQSVLESYVDTYSSFYITDVDGTIQVSTNNSIGSLANQIWFEDAISSSVPISTDLYYLPTAQSFVITIATPMNFEGELLGLLVANVELSYFSNILANAPIGINGKVAIVNRHGLLVIDPNIDFVFTEMDELQAVQNALNGESGTSIERDPITSQEQFYTYLPLTQNDWVIIASVPLEELNEPVNSLAWRIGLITTASSLIVALAVVFLSNQLVSPIRQLTQSARALSAGDFNVEAIAIHSEDEIGQLADTFRFMTKELNELVNSLESRVAKRTRDLNIASDVSRQITTVLDRERLLPQLVEDTRSAFGLYHASVFLYYPNDGMLKLEAGTGEAGDAMRQERRSFHLDSAKGLVAKAAKSRQPVIINDVSTADEHLNNPLLPETRSEIALPMIIGDSLVGVLDLQAKELNRFQEEDIAILKSLAEQISIAVRNAELFAIANLARQEAERANGVKSQFLAAMSHELRTPLNGIINFTGFVADEMLGEINERQRQFLKDAILNAEHLLALINDILDISKIDAGSLKLFVESNINLSDEIQTIARTGETLLKDKPVSLKLEVADNLPLMTGDKRRIRQIILNLVSNACKFTEEGSVSVCASQSNGEILVTVKDTGPGIAAEDYEKIFETFLQTDAGLRKGGGTGLGLPISRRLAEAHGGRLWVDSALGEGSSFHVSLPVSYDRG